MNRLTTVQHHDINVNNRIYFNSPYNSVRPFISSNDNGIVLTRDYKGSFHTGV